MQKNPNRIRLRVYILCLYLILLPIDSALGNIIGSISIINYVMVFYVASRMTTLLKRDAKIRTLARYKMPCMYFMYFMLSLSWSRTYTISTWYIFSFASAFAMFVFSATDVYSDAEIKLMRDAVVISGVVVLAVTFLNLDLSSGTRFRLSLGETMDPNYFATGFVLITASLVDNISEKRRRKSNAVILMLLIVVITMTGSRGGLLANMTVILAYAILRNGILKTIPMVLFGSLLFMLGLNLMQHLAPQWVIDRFTVSAILSDRGSGRTAIWLASLSYYRDLPIWRLLFGTGFSTFQNIASISMGKPKAAHSIYVQSLVEGGVLGLLMTTRMITVSIRKALNNRNACAGVAMVGAAIGGLTLDVHISRFFWNILFVTTLLQHNGSGYSRVTRTATELQQTTLGRSRLSENEKKTSG